MALLNRRNLKAPAETDYVVNVLWRRTAEWHC